MSYEDVNSFSSTNHYIAFSLAYSRTAEASLSLTNAPVLMSLQAE